MKPAMNPTWLKDDAGKVIALNLGADFTAEHEWGINELRRTLGIDGVVEQRFAREKPKYKKPHGMARRKIARHESVKLYLYDDKAVLLCESPLNLKYLDDDIKKVGLKKAIEKHPHGLPRYNALGTAWDEGSFGVYGQGAEVDLIKDLYKAFQDDNVAVWIGGRQLAFENGGLILCVVDRTPADCLELLRSSDEDSQKLQEASDATGIIKRLADANRGYFACSASWLKPTFKPQGRDPKSAHPVIYFLNPMGQDTNNSGWFTVEDLDDWIAGKGVIPINQNAKA